MTGQAPDMGLAGQQDRITRGDGMRQRNTGRKSIRRCLPVIGLAVMLTMAWIAFGGGAASAADRDIEWGSYQNSAENNGVVGDRKSVV